GTLAPVVGRQGVQRRGQASDLVGEEGGAVDARYPAVMDQARVRPQRRERAEDVEAAALAGFVRHQRTHATPCPGGADGQRGHEAALIQEEEIDQPVRREPLQEGKSSRSASLAAWRSASLRRWRTERLVRFQRLSRSRSSTRSR